MSSANQRKPLNRERILDIAVVMADADGISKLSMRSLAAELGYEVMSLYNHVSNKADLLVGMTDRVAAEIPRPESAAPWRQLVRAHALEMRAAFERHSWAVPLWVSTIPGPVRFDLMDWELSVWNNTGLEEQEAHHAFHAVNNHVVGYLLQASMMPQGDEGERIAIELRDSLDVDQHSHVISHINQHFDGDHGESFEYVLDLIIDGIGGG
ncbi:MAG: TetR/AcrR family transcriptional regulator C-terminal domain-containing protein [Acidimicrobiia bacterium]